MEESKRGPRIIPVMDIRGGIVVRAIAGRREEYKPLVSRLTDSTEPLVVAEALRRAARTDELYVADLDAICDGPEQFDLIAALVSKRHKLWVDQGIAFNGQELSLFDLGVAVVVAGLETIFEPFDDLGQMVECRGPNCLAFSLDLRDGRPVGDRQHWPADAKAVVELAWKVGVRRMIVLDLARVGVGGGTGTLELCSWSKSAFPALEIIAGGGVCGPEDLPALADAGVDAVLVASALHDGKFGLPEAPM